MVILKITKNNVKLKMRKKDDFKSVQFFSLKFITIRKYQILFVANYSFFDIWISVVENFIEKYFCNSLTKKKCNFLVHENGSVIFKVI